MAKPKTVDEYLAGVPEEQREALEQLRETISYGIPAFKLHGSLVGFAAFKNHCSFFPMSSTVLEEHRDALAGYETSKGTIRFSADDPLPVALVKKLVKARIAENEAGHRP